MTVSQGVIMKLLWWSINTSGQRKKNENLKTIFPYKKVYHNVFLIIHLFTSVIKAVLYEP